LVSIVSLVTCMRPMQEMTAYARDTHCLR
jgi:hypothetical protein